MQPIIYYAIVLAGLALLFAIGFLQTLFRSPAIEHFVKRPLISLRVPCTRTIFTLNRLTAITHVVYWAGTSMYNVIGVRSFQEGSVRAISLAALNVIPLLAGDRLVNTSQILRIELSDWRRVHMSIGLMTAVQVAVHIGLYGIDNGFNLHNTSDVYAFGALLSASIISTTYSRMITSRHFEFAKFLHLALACSFIVFLWQRLGAQLSLAHLFLAGGSGLHLLANFSRLIWTIWKNLSTNNGWSTAMIEQFQGATALNIRTARKINFHPGQYIYLWTPSVSLRATFQSHPFNVAWTSESDGTLTVLAQTRRDFTRDLAEIPDGSVLKVAIEGPYGPQIKIDKYKTIIFVSSGAGILAQTALLKSVMSSLTTNSVRKISVIWRLETEAQEDWVGDWISTALMPCDTAKQILRFKLFVMNNFKRKTTTYGQRVRYGVRTQKVYGDVDIDLLIATEERASVGQTLLLVSAEKSMRDDIQRAMTEYGAHNMHYQELEFQPDFRQRTTGKRAKMPKKQFIGDETQED